MNTEDERDKAMTSKRFESLATIDAGPRYEGRGLKVRTRLRAGTEVKSIPITTIKIEHEGW